MGSQSEYFTLTRKAFFIPGMIWPREMTILSQLFGNSTRHAEVGVFCGKSLFVSAAAMHVFGSRGVPKKMFAVDNFSERLLDGLEMLPSSTWWKSTLTATMQDINSQFQIQVELIDDNSSSAAAKLIRTPEFDSIYLDANHAEEFIGQDICSWWPLLKIGGTMAGHDYSADQLGVMNAVNNAFGDAFTHVPNTRIWHVQKTAHSIDLMRQFSASI